MSQVRTMEVAGGESGLRLDRWFRSHFPDLSHGRLEKLLRTGQIRVDGARAKSNLRLETGQTIRIPPLGEVKPPAPKEPSAPRLSAQDRRFMEGLVLHKDDDVLVLNKPAGLAVQGGTGTGRHVDGLLEALQFKAPERPRLVHRLDRDTSGVLVLARTRAAAQALTTAFKERSTRKIYWGVTVGVPAPKQGTIDLALSKQPGSGPAGQHERMRPADTADADARRAITHYSVVASAARKAAFVALMPVTGRTHQLRAHCVAIGTPLVGDRKYGGSESILGGVQSMLHLHAREITMVHPAGGTFTVSAPLPPHMAATWELFGFETHLSDDPFEALDRT